MKNIFELKNVTIDYQLKKQPLRAVSHIDMSIKAGKVTALVGESGSGKTTLASALINCLSTPGRVVGGEIVYLGSHATNVLTLDENQLNRFRWSETSMVFQSAQSALNPLMTIEKQFEETYRVHHPKLSKKTATQESQKKTIELLKFVNLDETRVMNMYPHELSGGMKQRVMIAFSLLLDPKLIILDEPTTALDVILQGYIFNILKQINLQFGISMLLLTHDIGVVAEFSDDMGVMYGGKLMEFGLTRDVFKYKRHPYTEGLIKATPSLVTDVDSMEPIPGSPPDMFDLPSGCVFHPRCPYRMPRCITQDPKTHDVNGHHVKCHLMEDDHATVD